MSGSSSSGECTGVPTPEELLVANRRLAQENEWLRQQLTQAKAHCASINGAPSLDDVAKEREAEVQGYLSQLRVDQTTIARQYDELLELRQRCKFYETAIEETTSNVAQLKALHKLLVERSKRVDAS